MRRCFSAVLTVLCIFALVGANRTQAAGLVRSQADDPVVTAAIVQAVDQAVGSEQNVVPAFAINRISVSKVDMAPDGNTAAVWLASIDPKTGKPIAREPVLAVARLVAGAADSGGVTAQAVASNWELTFPSDADWQTQIASLPADLLPQEYRNSLSAEVAQAESAITTPLGGYLLPWAGGQAKMLTWSVSHASCLNGDCRYAFDFADGTHWPILAAKGGTVYAAYDSVANDNHDDTNYIILEDASTSPTTYQLYYHMEQNSIPAALKVKGTRVTQGQYLGNVDNTGASSGSHLHFMVYTAEKYGNGYWGQALDITFMDVTDNWDVTTKGGRPRQCDETVSLPQYGTQCPANGTDSYISGNYGSNPPTGGLTAPADGAEVTTAAVQVSGQGSDDLGIARMQVVAKTNGAWVEIGASQATSPFSQSIDLCAANIPDGPVTLGLEIWDKEGNQVTPAGGIRSIVKRAGCPATPPATPCTPGSGQVALYSEANYAGTCQVFSAGSYASASSLGSLGDNQAASIQVGANAAATLYQDASYQGRAETLIDSDRNLADNIIGSGTASSLTIQKLASASKVPTLLVPTNLTSDDTAILGWRDAGNGYDFMPELFLSDGTKVNARDFDHTSFWALGSLAKGDYIFKVCVAGGDIASNTYWTCPSGWKQASTPFSVSQATVPTATTSFPYTASFDAGAENWTAGTGWALGSGADGTQGFVYNAGGACQDGARCSGSPGVTLPSSGDVYLHFKYNINDPEQSRYYDLRAVQVSAASSGGTYGAWKDLYALGRSIPDSLNTWLYSPDGIKLACSSYCGKTVRIRFFFDSVDGVSNSGLSWSIDQVSLDQTAPAAATTAGSLSINGAAVNGTISPVGEADVYSFTAVQNTVYQADAAGSGFTPLLELLSSDQRSLLGTGHAAGSGQRISFRAPANGVFYLRVRNSPTPRGLAQGASGSTVYSIGLKTLSGDSTAPAVTLSVSMAQDSRLLRTPGTLSVSASDNSGEVSHVDYYIHLSDGATWRWWKIGTSWNAGDGWAIAFDPAALPVGKQVSLWARAYDWAQNAGDMVVWNLDMDDHTYLPLLNNN
jgi:murein DD-endopeptidase MepM/ murein hydrolase activator NlpD